ncbi:cache domain-containing protein [Halalkalibacter krulwichiae]|uniref:Cache domain-containing protein n=1 Tax=Halalkalibacter krulwichiae TaxID=199441 RepID=A0A1X9M9P5_9BACI|nr:cache domain-containing protein [Halalkalibacter krulwichiae]ARK30135.1 hypothetical protein BkAM31D_09840 [Halalkalibacter krulwichiae]
MKFFHSLFFKLLLCLLLISIVPISVVGGITYHKATKNMKENVHFHASSILDQKVNALENLYNELDRLSQGIIHNSLFTRFSENTHLRTHQQLYIELDKLLISIENIFPDFKGITLINQHGFIYHYGYSFNQEFTSTDFYENNWFKLDSHPYITAPHLRDYSNYNTDIPVYSFINEAWDDKLRTKSTIIIDFPEEVVGQFLNDYKGPEVVAGTFIYSEEDYILPLLHD